MSSSSSILFSPFRLGPVTLRNRTIRAAAFEGMCPGNLPSDNLFNYHREVAAGGIGMTTIAYAAVEKSGLSFPHQLWLNNDAVPGLRRITDAVHCEGAACSIQIGHCGNMSKAALAGRMPLAPSAGINLYVPTFTHRMNNTDIQSVVKSFGSAVNLARKAGFDAVEVHAGHGYLISQFISPYTNRRKDSFGGSLENRARFMLMVMEEVKKAAGDDIAVLVKTNMRDGFRSGTCIDECLEIAKMLENAGADALVLSGGFVSKAPMYVMHGKMPIRVFAHYIDEKLMSFFVRLVGNWLVKEVPFTEGYFLEDALKFRKAVKLPLVYVGGLISRDKIDEVLGNGFEMVALARALIKDPDFIKKLHDNELSRSECDICNYCIAVMYSRQAACIMNDQTIPQKVKDMMPKNGSI
ncbi:MAG: NADH:flavin oxidoreductase [Bacteroidales bacterium]|jgi:2,4-dienoyl-CoA reductase-like NADH-dependent reductase (Old Yellow Enzyme family)|nr:NADH:flavin oxidoreductase [Bacteroidales bacterium]